MIFAEFKEFSDNEFRKTKKKEFDSPTKSVITDRIFKFTLIHASSIYPIRWNQEIQWIQRKVSSFGENSYTLLHSLPFYPDCDA